MKELSVRRDRQLGAAWMPEMPSVARRLGKVDAELLKSGVCPICGAGPYTVPLLHVNKMHGIDQLAMRDLLGFTYSESVCDPTHSQAATERARVRGFPSTIRRSTHRNLSVRARQMNAEKLAAARSPEQSRAAALANRRASTVIRHCTGPECCNFISRHTNSPGALTCSPACRRRVRQVTAARSVQIRQARRAR